VVGKNPMTEQKTGEVSPEAVAAVIDKLKSYRPGLEEGVVKAAIEDYLSSGKFPMAETSQDIVGVYDDLFANKS
jgi:hypothetical protein